MRLLMQLVSGCVLAAACGAPAAGEFPPIEARATTLCDPGLNCERLGGIRLHGVLVLPSLEVNGLRLSQLSGLAWDDRAGILYTVSDKGALFGLKPEFHNDRLSGVTLVSAAALLDPLNGKRVKYRRSDAEGLDILNSRRTTGDAELLVSFEGVPRIARHRPDGSVIGEVALNPPLNEIHQYRYNQMLEAVCAHPREGILTAPETPLTADQGAPRLYRLDGRSWRLPETRGGIVAMECLPDGALLVLERDFSPLSLRTVITLRNITLPAGTPPGQLLDGRVIATLDSSEGLRIDNFEGLARHRNRRFFMVSDNNDLFLQRTLLVYFEILP